MHFIFCTRRYIDTVWTHNTLFQTVQCPCILGIRTNTHMNYVCMQKQVHTVHLLQYMIFSSYMQAIVTSCIYVQYFYLFSQRVPPLPRALNLFTTHIPSLHMNCRNFLKIPPTLCVLSVGIFLYKCGSFSPSHSLEQLKIED